MARAFRTRSAATTPEARVEAAAIQSARRRGLSNREIADRLQINERTVRKIVSGETSGRRIFRERMPEGTVGSSPNIFRAAVRIGYDANGNEIIRSVNVKLPDVQGPKGKRAPTFFDTLRLPDLARVAKAETANMQNRYGEQVAIPDENGGTLMSLRNIFRRDPSKALHTVRGSYATV